MRYIVKVLSRFLKPAVGKYVAAPASVAILAVSAWLGFSYWQRGSVQVDTYRASLIFATTGTFCFIATYSYLAPWWRNLIGKTIVLKDLALLLALTPITLSLFFTFNRFTSRLASAADLVSISSIGVIMLWRTAVWIRVHQVSGQVSSTETKTETKTESQN
jgi:hypothetical protein